MCFPRSRWSRRSQQRAAEATRRRPRRPAPAPAEPAAEPPAEPAEPPAETSEAPAETGEPPADTGEVPVSSESVTDDVAYVGGPGGEADPSLTPIKIGWLNQQGGPVEVSATATVGAQIAAGFINEHAGGIDGHPVEADACFIATSEEQGQQCGQQIANDQAVDAVGDRRGRASGCQPLNAELAG